MAMRPVIGEAAPPIDLVDADGRRWWLRDQLGRPVVVIFHRHIH
ncbi:MAG: peroxiredoxin family protein [Acidimicrobiia bacterium]|nr:peroxiredoxin family protein [Acidimicrobiia bacterium]MDH5239006.1 peroxiredoxin family protein [Acidimicrobiia bacterium]